MTHSNQGNDNLIAYHLRPLPGHLPLHLALFRIVVPTCVWSGSALGFFWRSDSLPHPMPHSIDFSHYMSAVFIGAILGACLGTLSGVAILAVIRGQVERHGSLITALTEGKRTISRIELMPGIIMTFATFILLIPYSPWSFSLVLAPAPAFATYGFVRVWQQKHSMWYNA